MQWPKAIVTSVGRVRDRVNGTYPVELRVTDAATSDLREGMDVNLKLDAFDFQKFGTLGGAVSYISPDSQLAGPTTGGNAFYQVKIDLSDTWCGVTDTT